MITQGTIKSHYTINCTIDCFPIYPFPHFTISPWMKMCPKTIDFHLDHFTISPLHHIIISLFHSMCKKYWFTIIPFGKWKNHCTISPWNHIYKFQLSYHITTSPYNVLQFSPFHHGATNVNPCSIIKIERIK